MHTTTQKNPWIFASILWMLNPILPGCEMEKETEFSFDEADMLAVLEDIQANPWEVESNGQSFIATLSLHQMVSAEDSVNSDASADLLLDIMGSARACGSRRFFAQADACIEMSILLVEGEITIEDLDDSTIEPLVFPVTGSLDVFGLELTNASLYVSGDTIQGSWNGQSVQDSDMLEITLSSLTWE